MNTGIDPPPPAPSPPSDHAPLASPPVPVEQARVEADATFDAPVPTCPNCGAPVHGPYCHACGQSEKGMVRSLKEVFSDLSDIVFNVDSRIFRSLFDLYFRPGFLTTEYIAGRRARYVTPFRLFFVLCLLAFFLMQAMVGDAMFANADKARAARAQIDEATTAAAVDEAVRDSIAGLNEVATATDLDAKSRRQLEDGIKELAGVGRTRKLELARGHVAAATTAAEADQAVADGLAALADGVDVDGLSAKAKQKLEKRQQQLRESGEQRKRVLAGIEAPSADPAAVVNSCGKGGTVVLFTFKGKPWHRETNPAVFDWLPDAANVKLNETLQHMCDNVEGWIDQPSKGFRATFAVLPQTLFFLMPVFALLLKLFYLFKRRLYMEHLLVALHSHAFLFLSIVVIVVLGGLKSWAGDTTWITQPLGWMQVFAWLWMFVYLYWMQKRVYRQGWIMTTLKYGLIGNCYTILLSLGAVIAVVIGLAMS